MINVFEKLYYKKSANCLIFIVLLLFYDVYLFYKYDTFQYLNNAKIILSLILDVIPFVLIFFSYLVSLNFKKAQLIFACLIAILWILTPVLIMAINRDTNLTSIQSGVVVFENGKMTKQGFLMRMNNTFVPILGWSVFVLISSNLTRRY